MVEGKLHQTPGGARPYRYRVWPPPRASWPSADSPSDTAAFWRAMNISPESSCGGLYPSVRGQARTKHLTPTDAFGRVRRYYGPEAPLQAQRAPDWCAGVAEAQ